MVQSYWAAFKGFSRSHFGSSSLNTTIVNGQRSQEPSCHCVDSRSADTLHIMIRLLLYKCMRITQILNTLEVVPASKLPCFCQHHLLPQVIHEALAINNQIHPFHPLLKCPAVCKPVHKAGHRWHRLVNNHSVEDVLSFSCCRGNVSNSALGTVFIHNHFSNNTLHSLLWKRVKLAVGLAILGLAATWMH